MMRKILTPIGLIILACGLSLVGQAQELPKPTYANSVIISIEHPAWDSVEANYMKNNLNFGLYSWLSMSYNHIPANLTWHSDWNNAANNIQDDISLIDSLVAGARASNVNLHIVLCSGLARSIGVFWEAKQEDVRNCEWYNDNKIAADSQINDSHLMDAYVFGSFSRYARKIRANVEAKAKAILAYLKQKMVENPGLVITVSGWGEVEMNYCRMNDGGVLYFCDYSPFAVMEFRDWLQHAGLYDDASGKYAGQGFANGGARYQGSGGLAQFNADYGTSFTDWRLRYFNWSLSDDYDQIPQDYTNNDPHRIPIASYVHGGMMPTSGSNYIAGGFDPPRVRQDGNPFWELWMNFRQTMVNNYVRDFAKWAYQAGLSPDRLFAHQLPSDYLFGSNPSNVSGNKRYYSSASPLWTAYNLPFGSMGATIFDIKFSDTYFARTTEYILPDIAAMSPNWAIMEYDPDTYVLDANGVPTAPQSSPDFIMNQYFRVYNHNAHFINFYRWMFDAEHNIKGTNKEIALRNFNQLIRDKARNIDLSIVFTPPKVIGLSVPGGALGENIVRAQAGVQLQVTGKIWTDENWDWKDWGDFSLFKVYRGSDANFSADDAHYIGQTTSYAFTDSGASQGTVVYYKWRAANKNGVLGPASDALQVQTSGTPTPSISLNPTSLAFSGEVGKALSTVQQVQITNSGVAGSVLHWQASANKTWIQLSPTGGTGNGTLSAQVNTSGLSAGSYSGQIKIEDSAASNSPQYVQVTLNMYNQIIASLSVDKTSLVFDAQIGTSPSSQNVLIQNVGTPGTTLHWQASADKTWIGLNPVSGTGDGTLVVQVNTNGLALGNYSGVIKVEDSAALNSPQSIQVTLHITDVPIVPALSVDRTRFAFGAVAGQASSTIQKALIKNTGPAGSVLHWQASADKTWIQLSPASGTGASLLEIRTNPAGLAAGTTAGTIKVEDPAALNSPQYIQINLTVYNPGADAEPFGSMDTPTDGSTVAGNVPVTGWVLDDVEVTKVEIKRSPDPSDSPVVIGTDGFVYIGEAYFVKGARPDVEAAYPTYPMNYRAGWGFMVLTNFLPNHGNGTFTLYAFAYDGSGHKIRLGQKTINADNAGSHLPFGTIDTPTQGGTASGNAYFNWGWALTPQPNMIPADGSTIWVWVDSEPLGHPVYNLYRSDIATLFPGYANTNGAVGYYTLDTTKYANGIHSIAWGLRDNAGNTSGIGSRFFEIFNAGGGAAVNTEPRMFPEDTSGRLMVSVEGTRDVKVQELERVEIKLLAKGNVRFLGWGETLERELPAGSTLDEKTGIFSWIPGPGFLGRHVLHFAATDGALRSLPVEVVVNIAPKRYDIKTTKEIIK